MRAQRSDLACLFCAVLLPATLAAAVPEADVTRPHTAGLSVADADAAAAWYEEMLGFRVFKRMDVRERDIHLVFLERNGFQLELVELPDASPVAALQKSPDDDLRNRRADVHGFFKLGLLVADADAVAAHLEALDVPLKRPLTDDEPFGIRYFLVQDPDGNTWQIIEKLTRPYPPTERTGHALTWDAARGHLLVFGGVRTGGQQVTSGDTWTWNGSSWSRMPEQGPQARSWAVASWDDGRSRVVLFGGKVGRSGSFNDTWEHDGERWHLRLVSGSSDAPPPRSHHAMAWDARRQRTVLFGGHHDDTHFADTWEWDGESWRQVATSGPPARALHAMVWDGQNGRVLLLGGAVDATRLADVWAWDGERWTEVGELPRPRALPGAAWDAERGCLVLFGGWQDGFKAEADTWEWDGENWTEHPVPGPSPRGGHQMTWDATNGRVVLFAGGGGAQNDFQVTGDLWTWNGRAWTGDSP